MSVIIVFTGLYSLEQHLDVFKMPAANVTSNYWWQVRKGSFEHTYFFLVAIIKRRMTTVGIFLISH